MTDKKKGARHGSSGYTGGRRRKAVASPPGSAAPNQASAVHERGPGSIPPEIVQSPAGPIEAKTEASYPIEAPGAVTSSPATCYPRDRSGGDCVDGLEPPSEVVRTSDAATLDKVLRPQEGNGPSSDEHDAHHHEPERVGLPVAHPPFEAPTGEETTAAGGAPAEPEPEQPGEHVCHTQPPCMECGPGEHRAVDGLHSAAPEPRDEPVAPVLTGDEGLDPRTLNELTAIGRAAEYCADEIRSVLSFDQRCDVARSVDDFAGGLRAKLDPASGPVPASIPCPPPEPPAGGDPLGKIGSYSSTRENQGVPESAACGPEKPPERTEPTERRPQPTGQVPCPHCDDTSCENGCHCTTCRGLHMVPAYTCEQCGVSSARLHRTMRGTARGLKWLCDTCWSREIVGPRCQQFRETAEDRAAVEALVGSIMRESEAPAPPLPRPPINVMPERPLVTALDRMCAWLEHSELTADQSRLCESLLKKLQLCAASVMNAQLRRSWKPRDAS